MTILFDLDGTLTDPKTGIIKSVQYALKSFGIDEPNLDALTKFIGPPLRDSFANFYGFSANDAELAVAKYREYFSDKGIFENEVYPGIPEMLKTLQNSRATLAVATSKPTVYARQILGHFALDGYFSFVAGSELDGTRSVKSEVINYALDELGVTDKASSMMVGDREHDIIGANEVGILSIGVTYGYGSRGELRNAKATHIVDTVGELAQLILNIRKELRCDA
jgi:phosphoglycolate phosphatase